MKLLYTERFRRDYGAAPLEVQGAFQKQLDFLVKNLRHPSLHAKKYDEGQDLWQARVNRAWRFYFVMKDDTYILVTLTQHP